MKPNQIIRVVILIVFSFVITLNVMAQTTKQESVSKKKTDPICDMKKEKNWKEFSVYQNDTVWFCSEVCRKIFLKKPEKYLSKSKY